MSESVSTRPTCALYAMLFVIALVTTLCACAKKKPEKVHRYDKVIVIRLEVPVQAQSDLVPDNIFATDIGDPIR